MKKEYTLIGRSHRNNLIALIIFLCISISLLYAAAAQIPDRPAKGNIHGKPFIVEGGAFEEGVLTLRQGKDFFADIQIALFLSSRQKHELPSGKTITITSESSQKGDIPSISIQWKKEGAKMPNDYEYEWFTRDYTMTLEFGQEKGNRLPGKINISLPDKMHSHVIGTFNVEIKGFRFRNGKPDLTTDSFTTFEFVAKEYLERTYPGQLLKIITHTGGSIVGQFGFADISYQIGDGWPSNIRLQFIKDKGTWRLYGVLKQNQLHSAHPLAIPGPQDEITEQFEYLAAKKLGKEVQLKFPDKGIYNAWFNTSYSPPIKMGLCSVQYTLGENKDQLKKVYLMRLTDRGWELDRELSKNESLNYITGKIEKK